jgi:hypothetical protein
MKIGLSLRTVILTEIFSKKLTQIFKQTLNAMLKTVDNLTSKSLVKTLHAAPADIYFIPIIIIADIINIYLLARYFYLHIGMAETINAFP